MSYGFCCQTSRSCDCASGQCHAEDMYLEQFDDVIRHSMPKAGLAGFFAEAIQVRKRCAYIYALLLCNKHLMPSNARARVCCVCVYGDVTWCRVWADRYSIHVASCARRSIACERRAASASRTKCRLASAVPALTTGALKVTGSFLTSVRTVFHVFVFYVSNVQLDIWP